MATYLEFVAPTVIVSGGGAVTRERYSGDNAQTWKRGQLLKLSSGLVTEALDNASAATLDTDDIAASAVVFLALEDVSVATAGKVKVQRILPTTILEGPLLSSDAGGSAPATATEAMIGTAYALYQSAAGAASGYRAAHPAGWFGVDKNNTTKSLATVVDVESNFAPVKDPNADKNAAGDQYARVRFKLAAVSAA